MKQHFRYVQDFLRKNQELSFVILLVITSVILTQLFQASKSQSTKEYLKVINNNIEYLPKVKIYINQQKLNYFLSDIPSTTKIWQSGKIVHFFNKDYLINVFNR